MIRRFGETELQLLANMDGRDPVTSYELDAIHAAVEEIASLRQQLASARSDALEEAALVCSEWHKFDRFAVSKDYTLAYGQCAAAISSLKSNG